MKTIFVVRGACGAGKSWLIDGLTQRIGNNSVIINMFDAPRGGEQITRQKWLQKKLNEALEEHDNVIIEGIFAPDSPSWLDLEDYIDNHPALPVLVSIIVQRPILTILDAIEADSKKLTDEEKKTRIKFAGIYHPKFEL